MESGKNADMAVFDPEAVSDVEDYAKPDRPPLGIEHVLVNGCLAVEHGRVTGARPGLILRRTTP